MNLFQAISMAGKFIQLVMQLFFQRNVDLVSPFGNNSNRLIEITCFILYFIQAFCFNIIGNASAKLTS